ncbi:cytochrome b N-terminal domain-containing protein [Thermophagus xiamenensis]|uniref:Cytochrome b subunit of the bc complex n=1 Tax=Thermophagus xiamenensis TaxID=385682 RepID=A0A1I2FNZ7_9BACT|nr:cytochrome b N-terminal domain-containing protein [Thermophagus xiamenensis]SFF06753.1 Cytochrome b subunit of the bc complex [Thermophagus xiamenensis]
MRGNSPTSKAIKKFILHLHPHKIDRRAIVFTRTFGLGGIAALLFFILFITGMMLRFVYVPSAGQAYDSILVIKNEIIFGNLLRNLHYWSAMLLVIVAFLHLVRVFYSQSLFYERRKNWIYGLLLMFLVVSSNFTGYLLPWDQLSYWAVTIMTNLLSYIPLVGNGLADMVRDGTTVNERTLLRFYHFHTGLLPLIMVILMTIHFWLVRKAGGVALPETDEKTSKVAVHPHLIYKEAVVALCLILALLLFSMFVDAPLMDKAKPAVSPNPSKAPWYFMGFQELLMHVHPLFSSFLIPLSVISFLAAIPFFNYSHLKPGRWFYSKNGKTITIASGIFAFAYTFLFIILSDKVFDFNHWFAAWPIINSTGIIPTLLYWGPVFGFMYFLNKKLKALRIEKVIGWVTVIFMAYITMMLIGSFLRGEGMQLIF